MAAKIHQHSGFFSHPFMHQGIYSPKDPKSYSIPIEDGLEPPYSGSKQHQIRGKAEQSKTSKRKIRARALNDENAPTIEDCIEPKIIQKSNKPHAKDAGLNIPETLSMLSRASKIGEVVNGYEPLLTPM